jgi:hypothetical protein
MHCRLFCNICFDDFRKKFQYQRYAQSLRNSLAGASGIASCLVLFPSCFPSLQSWGTAAAVPVQSFTIMQGSGIAFDLVGARRCRAQHRREAPQSKRYYHAGSAFASLPQSNFRDCAIL